MNFVIPNKCQTVLNFIVLKKYEIGSLTEISKMNKTGLGGVRIKDIRSTKSLTP